MRHGGSISQYNNSHTCLRTASRTTARSRYNVDVQMRDQSSRDVQRGPSSVSCTERHSRSSCQVRTRYGNRVNDGTWVGFGPPCLQQSDIPECNTKLQILRKAFFSDCNSTLLFHLVVIQTLVLDDSTETKDSFPECRHSSCTDADGRTDNDIW